MTTTTPVTVSRISAVADNESAMEQLRDGMSNAVAELAVGPLEPSDRAMWAFEREAVDTAILEIGPRVADLLTAAVNRRLPWTWEPGKPPVIDAG